MSHQAPPPGNSQQPNPQNPFNPPQSFAQQGGAPQGQPTAPPPGYPPTTPPPAQPPYQQPQPPAPEPKKRSWFARHKILTTLGALVLIGIIWGIAGGGGDSDDEAASTATTEAAAEEQSEQPAEGEDAAAAEEEAAQEEPAEENPGIGTPVRDGDFEFTVNGVETGIAQVGSDMFGATAQGQFVLVSITITNIGNEAQSFFGDNATLVDTEGREHSADTSNSIYLDNADSIYSEVNPGNTLETQVLFDIPADAVPASIELHDSLFSGGVTVALQ